MSFLEFIESNRINHGYLSNNFKVYKRFCNKQNRRAEDLSLPKFAYKMESNLCKFKMLKSNKFLKKNTKMLKKIQQENNKALIQNTEDNSSSDIHDFVSIYRKYIECFLNPSVSNLLESRAFLCDYHTFLNDLYTLLDDRHDFTQYRLNYQWNDITLQFESQKQLQNFVEGKLLQKASRNNIYSDNRFNAHMARRAASWDLNVERFIQELISTGDSNTIDQKIIDSQKKLYLLSKELYISANEFNTFLMDNFVDSNYVRKTVTEFQKVYEFVETLIRGDPKRNQSTINEFVVPEIFGAYRSHFEKLKLIIKPSAKSLRNVLLDILRDNLTKTDSTRNMPFLPVTYDLGYDFIKYPDDNNENRNKAGFFKK